MVLKVNQKQMNMKGSNLLHIIHLICMYRMGIFVIFVYILSPWENHLHDDFSAPFPSLVPLFGVQNVSCASPGIFLTPFERYLSCTKSSSLLSGSKQSC